MQVRLELTEGRDEEVRRARNDREDQFVLFS